MFSPMVSTLSCTRASTVISVPAALQASKASKSAGFSCITVSAQIFTKFWNSAFFATKSVSALTSITTPAVLSSLVQANATPSAAILPAFLVAAARPFSLKRSIAFSILPSASVSAFLQSIIPQPVFSLKAATSFAVNAAIFISSNFIKSLLFLLLRKGFNGLNPFSLSLIQPPLLRRSRSPWPRLLQHPSDLRGLR